MKTQFWRRGATAILAAGLLAIAAVAQTGEASGEVKIEGAKPPKTATVQAKPSAKSAKPSITDRDPFVNSVDSGVVIPGSIQARPRVSTAPARGATVRPATPVGKARVAAPQSAPAVQQPAVVEPVIIVPAPEVTITGIIKSAGSRQAIVNSGTSSYIVTPGQKLGSYRVASITDTAVTFTHTGKSFKIPIR